MPDSRSHRGPHPQDERLFGTDAWPRLRAATDDLCWLLGRDYPGNAALKLVGDRYALTERQRKALTRAADGASSCERRRRRLLSDEALQGASLWIDGLNVLTTLEVALSGGVVLVARDGCLRDIAGVHGSYRHVDETVPAIQLLGHTLASLRVAAVRVLLDRPVSNSGRLSSLIREQAAGWPMACEVELVADPDPVLRDSPQPVASADRGVLDGSCRWTNLARRAVREQASEAWLVDLG